MCFTDGFFLLSPLQHNTFQCVLAYSSTRSYVLFLYEDGGMQWTQGAGSQPALVGLKNGESR